MRDAIAISLSVYLASAALFWLAYYREPRAIDWHHLSAYLTLVGFIMLSVSAALMKSGTNGRYKNLHIAAAILTSLALIATILLYKYAMLY
ncbi:MAG: hypothetical protein HY930_00625 [Euryarchaeota archaeon]|nr:hypothetical protein [Euryarchaeota archaeon]